MTGRRPVPVLVIGATGADVRAAACQLLAVGHRLHGPVHNPSSERARRLSDSAFVRVPIAQVQAWSPDLAALYAVLPEEGYGMDLPRLRARYRAVDWLRVADLAGDSGLSAEGDRRLSPTETSADV